MATYWENSCSFGLRYVSWYKYLIVSLVFSHLGFWSGNLFLIAPFPDLCLLVPFCHYENLPIQYIDFFFICKKNNKKFSVENLLHFFFLFFCSKHRLWVHVRRRFKRIPTIYVLGQKYEKGVYSCIPQFCYIKVGYMQ